MFRGSSFKLTQLLAFFVILGASSLVAFNSQAALSVVRGKAWWGSDMRYVYFNCLDDVMGDRLDVNHNLCGGDGSKPEQECVPPDFAFHLYSEGCSSLVHGVYIDEDGKFSGSAWNYAKGLISFEATTTPDAATPDRSMLSGPCLACYNDDNCWACYNEQTQRVYGWARATVDGTWLRLDGTSTPPTQLKSWNAASSTSFYYPLEAGDFVGSATTALGDFSFNCQSENGGASTCGLRDYKAYIGNLQVGSMSAPNWTYGEACISGARKAVLKWHLKSGYQPEYGLGQSAYRVIINTVNSTSSPVFDSGKRAGSANQLICPGPSCTWTPNYNTSYYWWVQLWDASDQPTEIYQYQYNTALDTDGNSDSNNLTFTTYKHEFPSPFFIWDPYDVSEQVGTSTEFTSYSATTTSTYYADDFPALPKTCATPNCQYLWTVDNNPGTLITATTSASTSIVFMYATRTVVTLKITDNDGYYCSQNHELYVNFGLPIWREVKAQ